MPVNSKDDSISKSRKLIQKFIDDEKLSLLLVLGPGGTGKSALIRELVADFNGKEVVLAPMGIAAEKVEGKTINSYCEVIEFTSETKFHADEFKKKPDHEDQVRLVLLDEISMVSIRMFRYLDKVLRHLNGRPTLLFGGAKIIMFGDQYQLSPVKAKPAYSSKMFQKHPVRIMYLTKNYRQSDKDTQGALRVIRKDKKCHRKRALKYFNDHCFDPTYSDDDSIIICSKKDRVAVLNKKKLKKLSKSGSMIYKWQGKNIELRIGARVIATINNPTSGYYNGSLGIVTKCEKDGPTVKFDAKNRAVKVRSPRWFKNEGKMLAIPLELAFAITIHKAQGQTFEKVILDLTGELFAKGQLYVALSRVRNINGLKISRLLTKADIIPNDEHSNILRRFEKWT